MGEDDIELLSIHQVGANVTAGKCVAHAGGTLGGVHSQK